MVRSALCRIGPTDESSLPQVGFEGVATAAVEVCRKAVRPTSPPPCDIPAVFRSLDTRVAGIKDVVVRWDRAAHPPVAGILVGVGKGLTFAAGSGPDFRAERSPTSVRQRSSWGWLSAGRDAALVR